MVPAMYQLSGKLIKKLFFQVSVHGLVRIYKHRIEACNIMVIHIIIEEYSISYSKIFLHLQGFFKQIIVYLNSNCPFAEHGSYKDNFSVSAAHVNKRFMILQIQLLKCIEIGRAHV